MSKIKIALSILAVLFGIFLIVFGGYDDSPGGQMIGLVVAIVAVIALAKNRNKSIR